MNTIIVMTSSAIMLGLLGIIFTFVPMEIIGFLDLGTAKPLQFLIQITGALYFAFGMLNWMQKTSKIGGIYNRPIAVANFSHFTIAGLALIKGLVSYPGLPYLIWIIGIIYLVLAISFAIILFRHPLNEKKPA